MNYSNIERNGSARDEAFRRRNDAVREALGTGVKSTQETEKLDEPKNDKPADEAGCNFPGSDRKR